MVDIQALWEPARVGEKRPCDRGSGTRGRPTIRAQDHPRPRWTGLAALEIALAEQPAG